MHRFVQCILCFVFLLLYGCASIQSPDISQAVREIRPVDDSWRCVFKNPELVRLIEAALENNADIRIACLNAVQAEATLKAARLAYFPSFSLGIEGGVSKPGVSNAAYTYNLPISMQWELNLFEQISGQKSASATHVSSIETIHAVQIQMVAAVASHYYTLVSLHEQLDILKQNTDVAQKTIEVMDALKTAGIMNEGAVSQARTQYLSALASEQNMLQKIQTTGNDIRVLLGNSQMEMTYQTSVVHELPLSCETSYPVSILAVRPDVRAAEHEMYARFADVDVARAAFYPSLNITASIGWTNNIGEIVNPGKFLLNMIGSIVQPLFQRGQSVARLTAAKAEHERSVIAFSQALLTAGTELSNALTACQSSRKRREIHKNEAEAADNACRIHTDLMQNGASSYLEVLAAQSSLLQSQIALAEDKLDIVQGQINLYKALGGSRDVICIGTGET